MIQKGQKSAGERGWAGGRPANLHRLGSQELFSALRAKKSVSIETAMTFSVHAVCVLLLCLSTGSAVLCGISCNAGEVMNGTNFEGSNIDSIPLHPKDDASAMATWEALL
jgi:hypothetical protein